MSGINQIPAFSPPAVLPSNNSASTLDSKTDTRRVARDLEATFLTMLLKEMRQSFEPDGGLFPGDTGDVQGGLFDLYMGQHLAATGGFGLATALDRQLRISSHADTHTPPAGGTVAGPTGR